MAFTITNTGEATSGAISAQLLGTDASDFLTQSNNCSSLAGGATCQIAVSFRPSSAGNKSANLSVTASPGGAVMAALDGTGQTTGALAINPSTSGFPNQVVNTTSATTAVFTVSNTGSTPTGNLSVAITGNNPSDFTQTNTCTAALTSATTCTVTVTFAPMSTGIKSASIDVSGTPGGTVHGIVSGTAIADATLELSPSAAPFGSTVVNQDSSTITFTANNNGDVATGALTQTITGADAGQFSIVTGSCNVVVNAHSSCTVVVRFHPTSTGMKVATLSVQGTPGGTATSMLTGDAISMGQLVVSPTANGFPITTVNQSSASQTFTITNTGASATGPITAGLAGADASQFTIPAGSNLCNGVSLPGGGNCTVAIQFSPTLPGDKTAALSISATPGANPPITATLTGTALAAASLQITPTSKDYGVVGLLNHSAFETFTIKNIGGTASGTLHSVLNGANATQFDLIDVNCEGNTLAPSATCTVTARFSPTNNGAQVASLDVTGTPGGTASSQLFGIGTSPAMITVDLASFDFPGNSNILASLSEPATLIGTNDSKVFTVKNTGGEPTGTLAITKTGATSSDFTFTTTCTTLISLQTCTITVTFAPTAIGTRSANFSITTTPGGTTGFAVQGDAQRKFQVIAAGGTTNPPPVPTIDYGTTPLNPPVPDQMTVTVRNNTNAAATLNVQPAPSQYTYMAPGATDCNTSVASGASCNVMLAYNPTTEATHAGTLTIQSSAAAADQAQVNVTGKGIHSLSIAPSSQTFDPDVASGAVSGSLTYVVTNMAKAPTAGPIGSKLTGSTDFQIVEDGCAGVAPGLAAGSSCNILVKFLPTSQATGITATLHVNAFPGTVGAPGNEITATATGNGVAPGLLTTTNVAYGTVFAGATLDKSVTFTNTGGVAVTLGATSKTGNYTIGTNNCTAASSLDPGDSCTMTVTYHATDLTGIEEDGSVTLASSANSATSTLTGHSRSSLSFSGSGVFGDVVVGTSPNPTVTVTVHNDSGAAVTVGTTPAASPFNVITNNCTLMNPIAAGATCTIVVAYTPANGGTVASLPQGGTLTVNSATGIASIPLQGNAISITNLQWTSPTQCGFPLGACGTRDFGSALQGQPGDTQSFTLINAGGQTSGVPNVVLSNLTNYTLQSNSCTAALANGATCSVTVRFTPAAATAQGNQTATLTANSTPGNNPVQNLTARVTASGGVVIAPATHTFGSQTIDVDDDSAPFDFTVTNTGAATATLAGVDFWNDNQGTNGPSTQFTRITTVANNCGTTLTAGQSCVVRAYYTPKNNLPAGSITRFLVLNVTGVAAANRPYASLVGRSLSKPSVAITSTTELSGTIPSLAVNFDTNTGGANGIAVNTTKDVVLTLTNSGETASGAISTTALAGANTNQFAVTNGCTSIAANGGTCTITVRFKPTQTLTQTASFSISSANLIDGDSGGLATTSVALGGTGLNAASLSINPSSAQNDDSVATARAVGSIDGTTTTFTISNINGSASTGELSFSVDDANFAVVAGGTCVNHSTTPPVVGTQIAANGSCTILVKFNPTTIGTKVGHLNVTASPGGSVVGTLNAKSVSALTASAPGTCIDDTCTGFSLGTATVTTDNALGDMPGMAGAVTAVVVNNRSTASVGPLHATLTSGSDDISFSGTGGSPADGCSGTTLAGGGMCSIRLRLNSTGTAHSVTGSLTVHGAVALPGGGSTDNGVVIPLTGSIN